MSKIKIKILKMCNKSTFFFTQTLSLPMYKVAFIYNISLIMAEFLTTLYLLVSTLLFSINF